MYGRKNFKSMSSGLHVAPSRGLLLRMLVEVWTVAEKNLLAGIRQFMVLREVSPYIRAPSRLKASLGDQVLQHCRPALGILESRLEEIALDLPS